jgi:hypothetical protein
LDEFQVPANTSLHLAGLQAQVEFGHYDATKTIRFVGFYFYLLQRAKKSLLGLIRTTLTPLLIVTGFFGALPLVSGRFFLGTCVAETVSGMRIR